MSDDIEKPAEDPRVDLARDRTGMATYRTELALDRTTLAWIRTTLTMASFGFGMVAFFRAIEEKNPTEASSRMHSCAIRMGVSLILVGIVAMVLAGASHWVTLRRLHRGQTPILTRWPLSLTVALLCAIIALAGLWFLLVA